MAEQKTKTIDDRLKPEWKDWIPAVGAFTLCERWDEARTSIVSDFYVLGNLWYHGLAILGSWYGVASLLRP